jgi:hypothetical protein
MLNAAARELEATSGVLAPGGMNGRGAPPSPSLTSAFGTPQALSLSSSSSSPSFGPQGETLCLVLVLLIYIQWYLNLRVHLPGGNSTPKPSVFMMKKPDVQVAAERCSGEAIAAMVRKKAFFRLSSFFISSFLHFFISSFLHFFILCLHFSSSL